MDTRDLKVINILNDQSRFVVPVYQRNYKWGENLWRSFWEDVESKTREELELENGPKFVHYMGALILAPERVKVGITPQILVVDGQQRLTTFQLFLTALRDVSEDLGYCDISVSVKDYLFNSKKSSDVDDDVVFKLAPNRADREIFYLLVRGGLDAVRQKEPEWFFGSGRAKKTQASRLVNAFVFFTDRIRQFALAGYTEEICDKEETGSCYIEIDEDQDQDQKYQRLQAILTTLLRHLKLVVISLGENDDAQVIFETLNSKSEPLTAMELVRNLIFQRAVHENTKTEKLFENLWEPLEGDFWRQTAPRARPTRPRIDHYLGHTLTAQTGSETSLKELYAEYRAFSRINGQPRFDSVESELDALLQFIPVYRGLEGDREDDLDLLWLGKKLALWEITTAYPVVFIVAVSNIERQEKRRIYELINSYLVRRMVCGLTPKNLNKNFQRIASLLLKEGVSFESFLNTFHGQEGDSVRFPSNDNFREAILQEPIYEMIHRKERIHEILWDLERAMRDKYMVDTSRPQTISVEHVLPQTWYDNWALPNGEIVKRDKVSQIIFSQDDSLPDEETQQQVNRREQLKHTLGNLTLITVPANPKMSNSTFTKKKCWLKKSLLAMNLHIENHTEWNEDTIEERGRMLADLAITIWPSPK